MSEKLKSPKDFYTAEEFRDVVGDKIFYCEFEKKDGSIRKMICRLGVTKHLKGGELTYNPADYNNLIVFDMAVKEYRTIKFDKLRNIRYNGIEV
jgi:hypothetical protein